MTNAVYGSIGSSTNHPKPTTSPLPCAGLIQTRTDLRPAICAAVAFASNHETAQASLGVTATATAFDADFGVLASGARLAQDHLIHPVLSPNPAAF